LAKPRRPNPTAPSWWSTDEWITPDEVVEEFAQRYAVATIEGWKVFNLDPCARADNSQAMFYYDQAADGLAQEWFGVVFVNPPYSNPGPWCQKAAEEVAAGHAQRVVMLLPPSIDTDWFHDWVQPFADVEFRRGRIAFLDYTGEPIKGARQGNMIAVYPKAPR
jgi:phage N-6-adenine-methyltransferase